MPLIDVRGDPWMGKSALLGALGDLARERGWTVAWAAGGSVPEGLVFGVFADALDELLSSAGDQTVAWLSPHHLSWLAGIFPALSWHAPAVALPANPSEHHHVLHAVRSLLGRLGTRNRLLLILDDMHLADEASVLLVQHLLRHPAPNVVLALAHRPRQDPQSLRILLGEAAAAGRSARLELPPLPDEDISGVLPRPLLPAHLRSLLHTAQGRPGLLRALALSAPWADDAPGAPPHSPADPSMPLLREFRGLSSLGRTVAHAAAVLQEPFDTALLAQAAQAGEDEARAGVDELVRLDILRPGTARGTFRFRDPLVRRTAHDTAGAAWQLGAHARAAAALRDRAASPGARRLASRPRRAHRSGRRRRPHPPGGGTHRGVAAPGPGGGLAQGDARYPPRRRRPGAAAAARHRAGAERRAGREPGPVRPHAGRGIGCASGRRAVAGPRAAPAGPARRSGGPAGEDGRQPGARRP